MHQPEPVEHETMSNTVTVRNTPDRPAVPIAIACLALVGLAACGTTSVPELSPAERAQWQAESIQMSCGAATFTLSCTAATAASADPAACSASRLDWQSAKQSTTPIPSPKDVGSDSHPTALACLRGGDGERYLAVQYAAFTLSCRLCGSLHLFDDAGRHLTPSQKTGTEPDNSAFIEQHRRLGSPALRWKRLQ